MTDTIIVATIVIIAAIFIGRRFFKQFTSSETACGCSGCGQSGSCGSTRNNQNDTDCCGKK